MRNLSTFIAILLLSPLSLAAGPPSTLLELAGANMKPARLSESVLVIIDAQKEYVSGALPLSGMSSALAEGGRLLSRAREADIPIVHIVHRGAGSLFNPDGSYFAIAKPLNPKPGEVVIEKTLPNAFAGTQLQQTLKETGRRKLIIVGFMTICA